VVDLARARAWLTDVVRPSPTSMWVNSTIYRVKGFIYTPHTGAASMSWERHIVHGVDDMLTITPQQPEGLGQADADTSSERAPTNRLVFIGRHMGAHKLRLQRGMTRCLVDDSGWTFI